jgi:coenzyme PQQ precursor peptide PqqA
MEETKTKGRDMTRQEIDQYFAELEMTWTTPILVEICIGLEINGYLPAEL